MRSNIGVDDTDHVAFFCGDCNKAMTVEDVVTERVLVSEETRKKDNCTYITLHCPGCGEKDRRKFHWAGERGTKCWYKTALPASKASKAPEPGE